MLARSRAIRCEVVRRIRSGPVFPRDISGVARSFARVAYRKRIGFRLPWFHIERDAHENAPVAAIRAFGIAGFGVGASYSLQLLKIPHAVSVTATAMNDDGVIVGSFTTESCTYGFAGKIGAFRRLPGARADFPTPSGIDALGRQSKQGLLF